MDKNELIVTYGTDPFTMTAALLEKADLKALIGEDRNAKIGLKPNLVVAVTPDTGATTHTEIICSIIEYLQKEGYRNITILESAWIGDSTERGFRVNGYDRISRKYGVPLLDIKKDQYVKKSAAGITMEISKTALDLDYLISLPVLKGHGQCLMTCALKNQKGLLSDRSKRMFHSLGLDLPIAALNAIIRPDFIVVDSICGDLDFEEGGTPVETNRMFVGRDSVLVDTYGASLMGYTTEDIGHLKEAVELNLGLSDLTKAKVTALNEAVVASSRPTGRARNLSHYTDSRSACSACYGNLIHALKKMEDDYDDMYFGDMGKICIGQEFRGKQGDMGVGNCTSCFKHTVKGCPPSATDILEFLRSLS